MSYHLLEIQTCKSFQRSRFSESIVIDFTAKKMHIFVSLRQFHPCELTFLFLWRSESRVSNTSKYTGEKISEEINYRGGPL